jgi:hypothetical protein
MDEVFSPQKFRHARGCQQLGSPPNQALQAFWQVELVRSFGVLLARMRVPANEAHQRTAGQHVWWEREAVAYCLQLSNMVSEIKKAARRPGAAFFERGRKGQRHELIMHNSHDCCRPGSGFFFQSLDGFQHIFNMTRDFKAAPLFL